MARPGNQKQRFQHGCDTCKASRGKRPALRSVQKTAENGRFFRVFLPTINASGYSLRSILSCCEGSRSTTRSRLPAARSALSATPWCVACHPSHVVCLPSSLATHSKKRIQPHFGCNASRRRFRSVFRRSQPELATQQQMWSGDMRDGCCCSCSAKNISRHRVGWLRRIAVMVAEQKCCWRSHVLDQKRVA